MATTRSRRKDLPWDFLRAVVAESNSHLPDCFISSCISRIFK